MAPSTNPLTNEWIIPAVLDVYKSVPLKLLSEVLFYVVLDVVVVVVVFRWVYHHAAVVVIVHYTKNNMAVERSPWRVHNSHKYIL